MAERSMSRREAIAGAAAAAAGAALYLLLRDGSDGDGSAAVPAAGEPTAGTSAGSCILTPEATEGPYYVDNRLIRRDIRGGKKGAPMTLRLTIQDADTCKPIKGATVEVWHCDALGNYSGVQGNGGSFLRGGQKTNAEGVATFKTIYPGAYSGRAVHIHTKVHVGGNEVHTGQLYFADATSAKVYRRAPYSQSGGDFTRNSEDGIYGDGGRQSTLKLRKAGRGYTGRLTMGVRAT